MELRQAHQSVQPFRTQDEYLYAMKEDLAEWFNGLYDLDIGVTSFFEHLENGVVICRHANNVQHHILQQLGPDDTSSVGREGSPAERHRGSSAGLLGEGAFGIYYRTNVRPGTFQSRDNISNFIAWCRNTLLIPDTLLFETDDLVLRKNERNVVLCLLEVARRGSKFGLPVPVLVQLEQEIDAEIAAEADGANVNQLQGGYQTLRKRNPIKVDMISLDELVRDVLGRCTCPDQFPMIKVSDGKYKIGDSLTMIFLRILRSHVMVRIGGGWDTLENYLNRHDPCRCQYKAGHGLSNTWSATTTKEDATSMNQPYAEDFGTRPTAAGWNTAKTRSAEGSLFANGTSDRSKNFPTSVYKTPPALDTTDSVHNGVVSPRTKSDGVTKQNPPEIQISQANPQNDSDRRHQSSLTGKSRRTDTMQEPAPGAGSIPDLAVGMTGRSSAGSPSHRRAHSIERQPRTTGHLSSPRPASATGRARSVDPLGPEVGRSLPRSASRSRERSAKDSDVLIISRNKEGKHRVKDSLAKQNAKMSKVEGTVPPDDNHPTKYPQQQQQLQQQQQQQQQSKTKALKMLTNTNKLTPNKPRPLLVRSASGSLENKEDVERPEVEASSSNHELKRSSSFGSKLVTTEPDDDRSMANGTAEFGSPLLKTNPDLLLEEYRKIGLEIQDLIKNAEDLDNSRRQAEGQSSNDVHTDDRNLLNRLEASPNRNETFPKMQRREGMTTRHPNSKLNNSTSRAVQPVSQTEVRGQSISARVLDDKPYTGASHPHTPGLDKDPGLGAAVERSSRRTAEAVSRKVPRIRSCSREPVKELTLPRSSSVNRNQRALSCTSRARNPSMDEDCDSGGSERTSADIRFDSRRMGCEEEELNQHRSRTKFARNRVNELSRGSDDFVSDATRMNVVNTPLSKPRAASNTRCPSTESEKTRRPEVTSLRAADDTDDNFSLNVDDYCRKALIRKDIVSVQKTPSRIPAPVEIKQSLEINTHHKGYGYGQLKRFDSGVDINNVSPVD